MTLKNVLMSSACCAGLLLSPLANAAGREAKTQAIVGTDKTQAVALDASKAEQKIFKSDAAALAKDDVQKSTGPSNSLQRLMSTEAKQVDFIQMSTKAHAQKTGHGKPAEAPSATSSSSGSKGGSQNPIAARVDVNARAIQLVASAKKAKSEKNAGGKPSEPSSASGGSSMPSASKGASQNPIAERMDTGARAVQVVASAKQAKAQKNASGKPGEPTSGRSGISVPSHGRSAGGNGGGRFAQFNSRVGAISPMGRGSPGERSHCNSRGMCY